MSRTQIRRLLAGLSLVALAAAPVARGQGSVVVAGVVVSSATRQALPYATIAFSKTGERFTRADGSFSVLLPPGEYSVRVRQLGYVALDTLLAVRAGGDARALTFALNPVAFSLASVKVIASSCASGQGSHDLGGILDEVTKNADRERLLRTEYPFTYDLERMTYAGLLTSDVVVVDTVRYQSTSFAPYKPGELVQAADSATGGGRAMRIPQLIDLADPAFLASHCFSFRGVESVGDARAYRVDFKPAPDVKGSDVEGSAFIDSATYMIKRAVFTLTRPQDLHPSILGLEVTTTYREIFAGVALFDEISSVQPVDRRYLRRSDAVQNQRLIAVHFYKRNPDGVIPNGPGRRSGGDSIAERFQSEALIASARGAAVASDWGARPRRAESGSDQARISKSAGIPSLSRSFAIWPMDRSRFSLRNSDSLLRPPNISASSVRVTPFCAAMYSTTSCGVAVGMGSFSSS